jgi:hypothetical protein
MDSTQDYVLGYFQPSLRDFSISHENTLALDSRGQR